MEDAVHSGTAWHLLGPDKLERAAGGLEEASFSQQLLDLGVGEFAWEPARKSLACFSLSFRKWCMQACIHTHTHTHTRDFQATFLETMPLHHLLFLSVTQSVPHPPPGKASPSRFTGSKEKPLAFGTPAYRRQQEGRTDGRREVTTPCGACVVRRRQGQGVLEQNGGLGVGRTEEGSAGSDSASPKVPKTWREPCDVQ